MPTNPVPQTTEAMVQDLLKRVAILERNAAPAVASVTFPETDSNQYTIPTADQWCQGPLSLNFSGVTGRAVVIVSADITQVVASMSARLYGQMSYQITNPATGAVVVPYKTGRGISVNAATYQFQGWQMSGVQNYTNLPKNGTLNITDWYYSVDDGTGAAAPNMQPHYMSITVIPY